MGVASDVGDFESAIRENRPDEALALYGADFLDGFRAPGCPGFDAWMEGRRLELLGVASAAAQHLAHVAEGHRDLHSALHWWRRTQLLHPFDEKVLRRIMALLAGSGNRCEAVGEFERFRCRMREELEIEPSRESQELARAVSVRLPDHTSMWIGDRRSRPPAGDAGNRVRHSRWRRPSDRVGR